MTDSPVPEATPKRRAWRQAPVRMPPQTIDRQGRITHLAFSLLGREPALSFLNSHHEQLGAKPLDLAGDSATGFSTVQGEVQRLAALAGKPQ
jgi:hypothetical protein